MQSAISDAFPTASIFPRSNDRVQAMAFSTIYTLDKQKQTYIKLFQLFITNYVLKILNLSLDVYFSNIKNNIQLQMAGN